MVLADGPLRALVRLAISDGFAKVTDGDAFAAMDAVNATLSPPAQGSRVEDVLNALLMYDTAVLDLRSSWGDTVDLAPLEREGLVSRLPGQPWDYMTAFSDYDPDHPATLALQYLRPLLEPRLHRMLSAIGLKALLEPVLKGRRAQLTRYHQRRFAQSLYELYVHCLDVPSIATNTRSAQLVRQWASYVLSRDERGDERDPYVVLLSGALDKYCWHFDQAAMGGIPLLSDLGSSTYTTLTDSTIRKAEGLASSYRLFRLVWKEHGVLLPRLIGIADLLRLRDAPRLRRFRSAVQQFTEGLRSSDIDNLDAMRQQVEHALKHLSSLAPYSRLARATTYLSLPVAAVENWRPLPVIGPTLAVVGAAAQGVIDARALRHDWVMFGQ